MCNDLKARREQRALRQTVWDELRNQEPEDHLRILRETPFPPQHADIVSFLPDAPTWHDYLRVGAELARTDELYAERQRLEAKHA